MDDDKYPHWKDALFGDHNAVANIRCAIHYVFWHGAYALMALLGVLLVGALTIISKIAPVTQRARPILNHPYVKRGADMALVALTGLLVLAVAAVIIYAIITQPIQMAIFGGMCLMMLILTVLMVVLITMFGERAESAASGVAQKARGAGERAVQTPGVRRVYGECPVSMDQAPKWFDDLFPEDDL